MQENLPNAEDKAVQIPQDIKSKKFLVLTRVSDPSIQH